MAWDPAQYLRFAGHRLRPALDLIARVPDNGISSIVDLGCGTGNVTKLLADRWPDADITGIDSSAEMLSGFEAAVPNARFSVSDIAGWTSDRPVDLIFSNAALHWLPGHDALFPHLLSQLRPGGTLAVQMPRNFARPSHTSVASAAADGPWQEKIKPMLKPAPTHAPGFYYDLMAATASELDIWETDYIQALEGENPVAEWTKGTWLRPFLDALDQPDRTGFEQAYRTHVASAYPKQPDGKTLLPFLRLFIVATRADA